MAACTDLGSLERPAYPAEAGGRESEASLIERARTDPGAFGRLYRRHYPRIAGYLYRRTGDLHIAEDLAAEVFLGAWRGLGRYRVRGIPFEHWLLRIATNQANRWVARRGAPVGSLDESVGAPDADEAWSERDTDVLGALKRLAAHHQAVLSLHHVEGLSVEAVSLVLGCRVGTVKSRLSRARESLRRELERAEVSE